MLSLEDYIVIMIINDIEGLNKALKYLERVNYILKFSKASTK